MLKRDKKIRFWAWVNDSPVRLTIEVGQTLRWSKGGPTEEGWHSEGCTWEYDGETLTRAYGTDGSDCDGRLSTWGEDECPVEDVDNDDNPAYGHPEINMPIWVEAGRGQRDQYAEAMGY